MQTKEQMIVNFMAVSVLLTLIWVGGGYDVF